MTDNHWDLKLLHEMKRIEDLLHMMILMILLTDKQIQTQMMIHAEGGQVVELDYGPSQPKHENYDLTNFH